MKLDIDTCKQCQTCKKKEVTNLSDGFVAIYCPNGCKTLSKIMPHTEISKVKETILEKIPENTLKIA